MKKFFVILALAAICCTAVCAVPAFASEQSVDSALVDEAYSFVNELCQLRRNDGDVQAWLTTKLQSILPVYEQSFPYNENSKGTNLIVSVKGADSSRKIVVGAHYDFNGGEGASDNACGVAALYLTLKQVAQLGSMLPYDVDFVAFGSEEAGLYGSQYYVDNVSADKVSLMINLDCIGIGDDVFVMCENKRTQLADLILDNAALPLKEKPYAKGTYWQYDAYGYGYYEAVQGSDHTPFRLAGIPVAFFFAGTYSARWGYAQSSVAEYNVFNTDRDTFDILVKECPQFGERVAGISQTIVSTLTSDKFAAVADNARNELLNLNGWYGILWPSVAAAVILAACAVGAYMYHRKLQKKALLGTAEVKNQAVFDKPDANDIFSFDGTAKGASNNGDNAPSDSIDDIFTFKK